jgi:hypothetical protein
VVVVYRYTPIRDRKKRASGMNELAYIFTFTEL